MLEPKHERRQGGVFGREVPGRPCVGEGNKKDQGKKGEPKWKTNKEAPRS